MQPTRGEIDGNHAAACPVCHDQVDGEILDVELGVVLERLLVERVQHGMAGAIGGGTGALRRPFTIVRRHTAERPLVDLAFLGARKRYTVVLEFDDRIGRFLAHVLDRILVAKPVGALDRVVHMPAPVVLAHVAKRRGDPALRRHRMAARREDLRNAGRVEAGVRQSECGTQAGAARANDDDVVTVIDEFVVAHAPIPRRNTENSPNTAKKMWAKRDRMRLATLRPWPCT